MVVGLFVTYVKACFLTLTPHNHLLRRVLLSLVYE